MDNENARVTRGFASDNNAGVHPDIMRAIEAANQGHEVGYGDDPYTARAQQLFRRHFGDETETHFVFNGTGANVLALGQWLRGYQGIICTESAHLNVDECGAPERFIGSKLLTVPTTDGKLDVGKVLPLIRVVGDQHHVQPRAISISQPTELGTVYTIQELLNIQKLARDHTLLFHMDGARIANAVAALQLSSLSDITTEVGVSVLSFGGTKNGMMYGEAVVFCNNAIASGFPFLRKQGMQLASKMRFISAQFSALLESNLWVANARHANAMAKLLSELISNISEIEIVQKVETNAVFAKVPRKVIDRLRQKYFFYLWDDLWREEKAIVRWMTSFDTTEEDVKWFVASLRNILVGMNP